MFRNADPTPARRMIRRAIFSPATLLLGFVVLLIATCPGARGDRAGDAPPASRGPGH